MSEYYSPKRRAEEKQRQRDRDLADLASGRRSAAELQAENGLFGLEPEHIRIDIHQVKNR